MKKHYLLFFTVLPFMIGFFVAFFHSKPSMPSPVTFYTNNILPTDMITISSSGDIYQLKQNKTRQITHSQNLIDPVVIGNSFGAISKMSNYSQLSIFDLSGKVKTLFDGNSQKIDTMSWISDLAVNPARNRIAFVSDKDKAKTNIPDNALYVINLSTGKSTNIANPAPYSGGIVHPIFDPKDGNIILFDYYQYDSQTSIPYSTIEQYNNRNGRITTLTFENRNAYQASLSSDGSQILFLGRNTDFNTSTLFIADFDKDNGISNIHSLLTGDIAYPVFSKTKNVIYYLRADSNKGYNLFSATIQNNKLTNTQLVIGGFGLQGNSSYSVN